MGGGSWRKAAEKIPSGSGATALDLLGQETSDSGGVGGPTAYFRGLFEGDSIQGRWGGGYGCRGGYRRQQRNS